MTADLESLKEAIEKGDVDSAVKHIGKAMEENRPPAEVLAAMMQAMDGVGQKFQSGECFVPEMLFASRAMKESMTLLEPVLVRAGISREATAVIGTVEGDLHDIGKDLVAMMWKGANFEVIDLGTNVAPDRFLEAVREHNPQLVGLSALLTTTMPAMRATIKKLQEAGLNDAKILVGGAPINQDFADLAGAHGYAPDAASAVEVARALLSA